MAKPPKKGEPSHDIAINIRWLKISCHQQFQHDRQTFLEGAVTPLVPRPRVDAL